MLLEISGEITPQNMGTEPKQKQHPVVDVTGDRSKVRWCIGTWNVRSMNQHKLEVVKQETARVNINILGISSLQFSFSVMSDSLQPHGLQNTRLLSPSPTPGACSKSCPSSQWWKSLCYFLGFPGPPANAADSGSTLGQEDIQEKRMVTHSTIPAWEIPWTEEPGGL